MLDFKPGNLKPKLSDSIEEGWNNDPSYVGGDKPRPYKRDSIQWVGAGFIPARKALISNKSLNLGKK